ncbi:MAG: transcriptional regulator, partial [Gallionellaceae bacterium CG11_big_fil_rev_8_21_14_0_20_60_62]
VGFDNAHGFHHRHFMGEVEPVGFVSFEDIEARFQADWIKYRSKK